MRLEHDFTVPAPTPEAWRILLDVPAIAPCLPGATVEEVNGDTITGRVRVKVGPVQITYRGTARFTETDETARRAVIEASGKESRGSGTATATVTTTLEPAGEETRVTVVTDLAVTGRPAQFGRGVLADVGGKLVGQFATCLAEKLRGGQPVAEGAEPPAEQPEPSPPAASLPETPPGAPAPSSESLPPPPPPAPEPAVPVPAAPAVTQPGPASAVPGPAVPAPPEAEPIDLLQAAGGPVAKRAAPIAAVLAALGVVVLWWRRRARR